MLARVAAVVVFLALLVPSVASAAKPSTVPVYDERGHLIELPFVATPQSHLTKERATAIFLAYPKVKHWLARYPKKGRTTQATFDAKYPGSEWTVQVWWGAAGEIATGRISDLTGLVTEAWTGPQVAWRMARGYDGAFGGKKINRPWLWLSFCALFFIGLADWRRPRSLRNLDLIALLFFTASLWFFNHGDIFTSVPLVYPPLVYLLVRAVWIGFTGRPVKSGRPVWPVWLLAAATVFAVGFRIGLNVEKSNVIDVGYAGVIGAQRVSNGQAPWGNFPKEDSLKPCGPADRDGEIRNRIQTNGRCESANERGDTYGPVAYYAYLPGYWILGWTGKWDDLPAVHLTSILWDLICLFGLALVGRRFGGNRLAVTLAFAWASYPFTQYVSMSNSNDAIPPAFLIWGFWLSTSPKARGVFGALAGWTKFAPLLVAPLWLTYPEVSGRRTKVSFLIGFLAATLAVFSIIVVDPHPLREVHAFYKWTIKWQIGRESPFSLWDWRQYHAAGIPNLHLVQQVLEGLVLAAAIGFAFFPRRKSPLQLAALTGALLMGFELVLTHWFYLYIPWFFPFAAFVALAGSPVRVRAAAALATHSGRTGYARPSVGAADREQLVLRETL
jgi:hypothetical protein